MNPDFEYSAIAGHPALDSARTRIQFFVILRSPSASLGLTLRRRIYEPYHPVYKYIDVKRFFGKKRLRMTF